MNWEKKFCCIISLSKKEWENHSGEDKNVQKLSLSGEYDWTEWERGCPGNVRNFNKQRERQKTSSYLYSMGTGNGQGNLISMWRTNRGAHDRRQPEDKNSLLLD